MKVPSDFMYSEEHMWVKIEEGKARIGITEFAQKELGDIVFVELPKLDSQIEKNEPFGSLESVKTVSELYAPLSGKVIEVNSSLDAQPEQVNISPYEQGWLMTVEVSAPDELKQLWNADRYIQTYDTD